MRSKTTLRAIAFLLCSASVVLTREASGLPSAADKRNCHFLAYNPGTRTQSDPAKRAAAFVERNWLGIENELATGQGEGLSYLRQLALCPIDLPKYYWSQNIRGRPYEERQEVFTTWFIGQCFCAS